MPAPATPRPAGAHRRNAASTRAAILEAARRRFAAVGYAHAGVREIAAEAGVNAALVNRYFGSKEQLFAEVLAGGFRIAPLLPEEPAQLGDALAAYVAARGGRPRPDGDPLLVLLRSATDPAAVELLRAHVDEEVIGPLARWLDGEDAEVRAALVAACLMGVAVVRRVLGSRALAPDADQALARALAPVLQACVSETRPSETRPDEAHPPKRPARQASKDRA
jgi:AcrR family transcriptional regulator